MTAYLHARKCEEKRPKLFDAMLVVRKLTAAATTFDRRQYCSALLDEVGVKVSLV